LHESPRVARTTDAPLLRTTNQTMTNQYTLSVRILMHNTLRFFVLQVNK